MQYKCKMQNAKCRIKGEATLPIIIELRGTVGVLWGFFFMSAKLSSIIYSLLSIICYLYVDSKARRGRIHASRFTFAPSIVFVPRGTLQEKQLSLIAAKRYFFTIHSYLLTKKGLLAETFLILIRHHPQA